jgi:hypothetical protein
MANRIFIRNNFNFSGQNTSKFLTRLIDKSHPRLALYNEHSKPVRTFDISSLSLEDIRELCLNLGISPESMLLSFDDINTLWDREKHSAIKDRQHRTEEDNESLIHEEHDPIHHSHEPTEMTMDPEVHSIDPPS